jgi:shikimate kinase
MLSTLNLSEQNLILTGYTGPNQPLLARQIADRLNLSLIHIETQIADRVGLQVDEVRTYYGEARLRSIETEIVGEAMLRRSTLIRVSARTLLTNHSLEKLSGTGPVICLVTTLDAMLHRLHLAMGARYYNPEERALEIGELRREWAVRGQLGVHEIDTTYLKPEETIEAVTTLWQSLAFAQT